MKLKALASSDKEMIRLIENGAITDLATFVEFYYSESKFEYDKELMTKRKLKDYENNKQYIDTYIKEMSEQNFTRRNPEKTQDNNLHPNIYGFTDEELDTFKRNINNTSIREVDFKIENINLYDRVWTTINPYKIKTYCITDKDLLDYFFNIITFLEVNSYIELVENDLNLSPFFKKKSSNGFVNTIAPENLELDMESNSRLLAEQVKDIIDGRQIYKDNDKDYSDEYLQIDSELLKYCEKYRDKKIIVRQDLHVLVENDFIPSEKKQYDQSRKQAWIAIIISGVIGLASIITSIFQTNLMYRRNNDFWTYNESIETSELIEVNDNLEIIQDEIQTLSVNENNNKDNTELIEKLDELIDLLSKYINKNEITETNP